MPFTLQRNTVIARFIQSSFPIINAKGGNINMAIKIYQLPDQVKGLLATLGCTSTVNGNRCSDYFIIAEDEEIGNDLSVSLIEERANLPQREWGYSMHVINDIKDTFCQIYHDDGNPGTPEEIALAMLKKIIAAELGIFSIPARLPTCKEWDALVDAVGESDDMLHWQNIFFWCQDGIPDCMSYRTIRGYHTARYLNHYHAALRCADTGRKASLGFRPIFTGPVVNLFPEGNVAAVGSLYMDGTPVRMPQNPVWDGDICDYIPGTKLEFRPALEDPAYQIQAIKVGNLLIADRVLLKNISWEDLAAQGFCVKD